MTGDNLGITSKLDPIKGKDSIKDALNQYHSPTPNPTNSPNQRNLKYLDAFTSKLVIADDSSNNALPPPVYKSPCGKPKANLSTISLATEEDSITSRNSDDMGRTSLYSYQCKYKDNIDFVEREDILEHRIYNYMDNPLIDSSGGNVLENRDFKYDNPFSPKGIFFK